MQLIQKELYVNDKNLDSLYQELESQLAGHESFAETRDYIDDIRNSEPELWKEIGEQKIFKITIEEVTS